MADKKNGFSHLFKFFKFPVAFCLKEHITYRKRLVNDQNFRINVNGNCKCQTDKHTAGIRFYRLINKISDICEVQDILKSGIHLFF